MNGPGDQRTGSVPSLGAAGTRGVKDTFVFNARLCGFDDDYVTSSHGNQCSWPPTRSHGAKPTSSASFGRLCERAFYLLTSLPASCPLPCNAVAPPAAPPFLAVFFSFSPSLFTSASYLSTLFREDYSRWRNNVFTRHTWPVTPNGSTYRIYKKDAAP